MKIAVACPQCQKQYQLAAEIRQAGEMCSVRGGLQRAPSGGAERARAAGEKPGSQTDGPAHTSGQSRGCSPRRTARSTGCAAAPASKTLAPKASAPKQPAGPPSFFEDELAAAPPPSRRPAAGSLEALESAAGRATPPSPRAAAQPAAPKRAPKAKSPAPISRRLGC